MALKWLPGISSFLNNYPPFALFIVYVVLANRNISKAKGRIQTNSRRPFCTPVICCPFLFFKCKCMPCLFVTVGTSEGRKMQGHHHEENSYTALEESDFPLDLLLSK